MKLKTHLAASLILSGLLAANKLSAQSWNVAGNAGTTTSNFLGTTDNKDFKIRTNNAMRITVKNSGKVGIGTASPTATLHLEKGTLTDMLVKSTAAGAQITVDRAGNGYEAITRYMQTGVPQWKTGLTVNATGASDYVIGNEMNTSDALTISGSNNFVNLPTGYLLLGSGIASSVSNSAGDLKLNAYAPTTGTPGNILLNYTTSPFKSGNVGIGTNDVSLSKFMAQGAVGNTVGLFRRNSTSAGVAIVGDWPGIYFNSYFNGGHKAMSPGYAGLVNFDPVNGNLILACSNASAAAAGDAVTAPNALTIDFFGSVGIGQTPNGGAKLSVKSGTTSAAIRGESTFISGDGVVGVASGSSISRAIYGLSNTGYAGYFDGNVYVGGTFSNPSDVRLKENIVPIENALNHISKLDAKTYNFKAEYSKMNLPEGNQYGLIAQEVEKVFPDLVVTNYDKSMDSEHPFEFKSINYIGLIPVLTQAIKEQNAINEKLVAENSELKSQVSSMNECIQSLCNLPASKAGIEENNSNMLFQNQPNPFNQSTTIVYNLTSEAKNAAIVIRGLNGEELKSVSIANSSKGEVIIHADELAQGTYTYTLVVNGKSIDTKLMVVTK